MYGYRVLLLWLIIKRTLPVHHPWLLVVVIAGVLFIAWDLIRMYRVYYPRKKEYAPFFEFLKNRDVHEYNPSEYMLPSYDEVFKKDYSDSNIRPAEAWNNKGFYDFIGHKLDEEPYGPMIRNLSTGELEPLRFQKHTPSPEEINAHAKSRQELLALWNEYPFVTPEDIKASDEFHGKQEKAFKNALADGFDMYIQSEYRKGNCTFQQYLKKIIPGY